jgi:hypothetical protein
MGGFKCRSRQDCLHYHASPVYGHDPVERLCGDQEEPIKQKPGHLALDAPAVRQSHPNPVAPVPVLNSGFAQGATVTMNR